MTTVQNAATESYSIRTTSGRYIARRLPLLALYHLINDLHQRNPDGRLSVVNDYGGFWVRDVLPIDARDTVRVAIQAEKDGWVSQVEHGKMRLLNAGAVGTVDEMMVDEFALAVQNHAAYVAALAIVAL